MEWEAIVNQHSNTKKKRAYYTRRKKYLHKTIVSAVVGIAFIVAALLKLVHPVLGETGMLISLCVTWYNAGRVKECA